MKIGKGEQEILEYLRAQGGSAACVYVVAQFAPMRKKAGDRNSYVQYHVIRVRLKRMHLKGLVRIENYGRTDCSVSLPGETE